jgi:uncharacterized RDD family membrane protein YckC
MSRDFSSEPTADLLANPIDVTYEPAQDMGPDFEYAGFARRLAAYLIDFMVLMTLGMPMILLLALFTRLSDQSLERIVMIVSILVVWQYCALLESSKHQATLGKILLGLQVVDLQGNRIGFWRATVRHFAKIISKLFFFLGFVIIDFTIKKQGMHDMMAGCLVIKRPKRFT